MLSGKEKKTIEYYDKNAKVWSKDRSPSSSSFWERDIEKFHSLLPKGNIIEIGTGSGREASRFIKLGYDYLGTDISKGLLGQASKNNPNGKFLLKSVYDLDFPEKLFDGFWCCATLLHVPKPKIALALKSIKKILNPGAIGFVSLKEITEFFEKKEETTGRYFYYYSLEEFTEILKKVGFEIIYSEKKFQKRKNGDLITWLTYFVKNN